MSLPINKLLFSLIALTGMISCYSPRYMYSPAATNVPVFTKKGGSKLAAYYANTAFGTEDEKKLYNYGFDVQAAYAVNNHWLVFYNQSNRYEKSAGLFRSFNFDSSIIRYKRSMSEIGGGFYSAFKDSSKMYFQLIAGLGFGKFSLDDNGKDISAGTYSRFHQTKVSKFFIQPAIQIHYNKNFSCSFASRFVVLWYRNIKTNYTASEQEQYLLHELAGYPRTFWEPAIISNFSFNKTPAIQFELQLAMAALISKRFVDYRSLNISAGAVLDIFRLKKGRK